MKSGTYITQGLLAEGWRDSGINKGDSVLIHSDIRRTIKYYFRKGMKITPLDISESFLIAVGPHGTLLFPTFNHDFCMVKK